MPRPVISADALRELRMARGWSVAMLSLRSGVGPSVLYRLESGETTQPYMHTLTLVARALRVKVDRLLEKEAA